MRTGKTRVCLGCYLAKQKTLALLMPPSVASKSTGNVNMTTVTIVRPKQKRRVMKIISEAYYIATIFEIT